MSTIETFFVPWYNMEEWVQVKDMLASESNQQLKRAYEVLLLWKLRFNKLPVHVECTLGVVQALVHEDISLSASVSQYEDIIRREKELQLNYSTAIIRFVNHASAGSSLKGDTLYLAARKQNIPDWVVNLRHDVAHSHSLPSLELLRSGAEFALKWLLTNYWLVQQENMSVSTGALIRTKIETLDFNGLKDLLKTGVDAWFSCKKAINNKMFYIVNLDSGIWAKVTRFRKNLKTIGFLPASEVAKTLNEASKWRKNTKVSPNENFKRKQIGKTENVANTILAAVEILAEMGPTMRSALVAGIMELKFIEDRQLEKWKPIIQVLYKTDGLILLLRKLFEELGADKESSEACWWLNILSNSFQHLQEELLGGMDTSKRLFSPKEDFIELCSNCPPRVPFDVLHEALLVPPSANSNSVIPFLAFVFPPLPVRTRNLLTELLGIFATKPKGISETDKVFSITDLQTTSNCLEGDDKLEEHANLGQTIWQCAPYDNDTWSRCPLGLLPGQIGKDLDLMKLPWRVIKPATTRKRKLLQ